MINIAELLKDAPKDLKLYSPICGHCKLSCILHDDGIRVIAHDVPFRFDKYGRFCSADDAECLIFPSDDCRTWEGWKLPVEPKFKAEDRIVSKSDKSTIYRIITLHEERREYIVEIEHKDYHESCQWIAFEDQDDYELAPKPHYDISNFYEGMPVLVREYDTCVWQWVLYSHFNGVGLFFAAGKTWRQCIPFKGNEHLLGTTNMPSEEYINW